MEEHHPIGDSFSIRRSIPNGFLAIRVAAGSMWLAGLLMSFSDGCGGSPPGDLVDLFQSDDKQSAWHALPGRLAQQMGATADPDFSDFGAVAIGVIVAVVLAVLVIALLLFAVNCFMQTGFIRLHEHILIEANDKVGPLFSGKDRFWHMAGYKLLSGLAVSAAAIATGAPGALLAYVGYAREHQTLLAGGFGLMAFLAVPAVAYVSLGLYLGEHAVALDGASPVTALRRAWSLAQGNRLPLFAFALLCFLVQVASYVGLLLCCVGILATLPFGRSLSGFAKTEGYLLFTRGSAESTRWRLWQRATAEEQRMQPVRGWGQPPITPAPYQPPPAPPAPPAQDANRPDEPPPDWPPRGPRDPNDPNET